MALRAEGLGLAYSGDEAEAADDVTIDLVAEEAIDQSVARVSVVIPTLNEERNLPHVLDRVPAWIDEVIIVDGLSTDDTVGVARRCRPDVEIVLESTPGKGAALRAGFAAATGDILVMLDADGSTDPNEIPTFVGALLGGADIVVGSRFAQGGGTADMERHRKLGNWVLTRLVRAGFRGRYSDLCYGYTAFWADVLPFIDGDYTGFEVETLIHIRALRASLKVAEVPSFESKRMHGISNLRTLRDGGRVLHSIAKEWFAHRLGTGSPRPLLRDRLPGARPATPPFSRETDLEVRERRRVAQ
jgi:glycosyltransferase involved in cell wall biosynthesis